ncbi:hypothetical protein GPL15_09245 [Clostridium sp. MCC353]|nr:hypothetical protein [Clostridium sp. MCC353]
MLAFAFSGLYTIVDGFFIGQNMGDTGLAAINIAFPLAAFIQAMGTGLGMGGAIQISIFRGRNDSEQEKLYLGSTLGLLLAAGAVLTALFFSLYRPLLSVMGANGHVLEAASEYMKIITTGTVFQIFATGLTPILRNFNRALLAMTAMVCGFITNILLDWLFVAHFQTGMTGAALATVIGQGGTILPCLAFLVKKAAGLSFRHYRWRSSVTGVIIKTGVSPFGLTMSPFLVMILLNKWAMAYGGESAVAAYAVISYVTSIVLLLLQGISDGSQPLISLSLGQGDLKSALQVRVLAYLFSAIIAFIMGAGIFLLADYIPPLFGASGEVGIAAVQGMNFFLPGFLFTAFCRVTTSYFYATGNSGSACLMVYGEPVLLSVLLIAFLPKMMGLNGVWLSSPASQFLLAITGLLLVRLHSRG